LASYLAPARTGDALVVRELRVADAAKWTEFVTTHPTVHSTVHLAAHPDAQFAAQLATNLYHTLLWRDLANEVFGHQPVCLLAERNGNVCDALPMFLVKTPLFGSKLISLPYDIGSGGVFTLNDEPTDKDIYSLPVEGSVPSLEKYYDADGLARRLWRTFPLGVTRGGGGLINHWFC
jgi:hypothetical protein